LVVGGMIINNTALSYKIEEPELKLRKPNLRKMCFKKCKNCRGEKCPNFYGYISDKKSYYEGVIHSKKIQFDTDREKQKLGMNKSDKQLIVGMIILSILLTIFGGFLI
jgi:hypothetical protein